MSYIEQMLGIPEHSLCLRAGIACGRVRAAHLVLHNIVYKLPDALMQVPDSVSLPERPELAPVKASVFQVFTPKHGCHGLPFRNRSLLEFEAIFDAATPSLRATDVEVVAAAIQDVDNWALQYEIEVTRYLAGISMRMAEYFQRHVESISKLTALFAVPSLSINALVATVRESPSAVQRSMLHAAQHTTGTNPIPPSAEILRRHVVPQPDRIVPMTETVQNH